MRSDKFTNDVLDRLEGAGITKGYVPKDNAGNVLGVSGVTIGGGVDLGQQTRTSLAGFGVPAAIIEQLAPYLGLKKADAVRALEQHPLTMTTEDVATLDRCVRTAYINASAARFDAKVAAAEGK